MENNKDRRTEGNDVLREAAASDGNEREFFDFENETIIFRKAYKSTNKAENQEKSDMQHTAQIRGGAVVRPLKQAPKPNVALPQNQNAPKIHSASSPAPKVLPKSHLPVTANPQNRRIVPDSNRKNEASGLNQKAAAPSAVPPVSSKNIAPAFPVKSQATPKYVQPEIPQKQTPQNQIKPIAATNKPSFEKQPPRKPIIRNTPVKNDVKSYGGRSENDDFEIDEATYASPFKRRAYADGGVSDSASGAMMSLVKAMVYIILIIVVSVGLWVFVINTAHDVFKFVVEDRIVTVNIPENATIDDVTDALYGSGAIKYKWAFKLWSNLKDSNAEFVPGEYEVSTTLNYDYLRASFKESTVRNEVRITIPEGYTVDEIIALFVKNGIGTKEGFVDVINNYDFDYRFLEGLVTREGRIYRLEGYLFPDTYYFFDDASEVTVIKKLLDNFNTKFVDEYYARCAQLGFSVDDAIILASMIEKETRYADELGYVSSVFHNRIKYSASFPYLNSDATIMYAMAHDFGERPETMTGEDKSYDSPYNTYKYKGLPPGPIANPGLNSIKYALYPNDSDYFFFVSNSTGRTLFAKTEAEHTKNINTVRGN